VNALDDINLRLRLSKIILDYKITTIIETGIGNGGSTYQFSKMVDRVIGIDNDLKKINIARETLCGVARNVVFIGMNSPEAIIYLEDVIDPNHTLYFLDAHWQDYWPLLDEIRAIHRGKGVIVIHDIKVPGCLELGYDTYKGQELTYEYVKDVLTAWSPAHTIEYNDDTAGYPRRGVMFVFP
jgi:predicted O-methyltransferase YrrM